jgi:hypothetical protein
MNGDSDEISNAANWEIFAVRGFLLGIAPLN